MCGIIGFAGKEDAVPFLMKGLRKLEYRGYDSAGIACLQKGKLQRRRAKGKLLHLAEVLKSEPLSAQVGLGHTRWATHGRPSEENAHPHTDTKGELAVVHNGIVENYQALRASLLKKGIECASETDSEVLAHLIEIELRTEKDLASALRKALKAVEGSYALAVVSQSSPRTLVAARQGSPLVLGLGQNANFLASDIPAFLESTREVIYLEDGDIAVLTAESIQIKDAADKVTQRKSEKVLWDSVQAEKSGYKHFMLKEIFEQPRVIEDTLRGRILKSSADIALTEFPLSSEKIKNLKRIVLLACGTSWHACQVGKFYIENFAKIAVEVDYGSEFRYRKPLIQKDDLIIAVSQSGETADTLAAMRLCKQAGAILYSICNVAGSSMIRESAGSLLTHAGPEIGVASTKAFSSQLTALYLVALFLGRRNSALAVKEAALRIEELRQLPRQVEKVLQQAPAVKKIAHQYSAKKDFLFIGRGVNYPIALEGALKMKEISYIHAEGYPAGEMKHGPIALIDQAMPVVAIATRGRVYEKMMSNIEEAMAREADVIALATEGDSALKAKVKDMIHIPACDEALSPVLNVIPLQLLSYYMADKLGCDVDQPRNLAKSVTVE